MPAWLLLIFTIILEVAGTISLKLSDGLSKFTPSVLIFVFYGGCFSIFPFVVQKMDLSVAYAIWSGVGTLAVSLIGILYFQESITLFKAISIILIILGVIGIKISPAT
ncbi:MULTISPECIES: DMT family transporter [Mesobacillus]|uniref:DNA mismatch repair protein MutS n=2 Tax=Mesobacillus TaxID=2675231 RepID=A0A0D6Z4T0_9BACI|nr:MULTISPECIES: multidrug efflux SMR transporter [Mesobacillus]KIY20587.1 DNA mismatch repair protein MutS [Mesobacillus subterraneus]MDQ0412357.1 small multidrug resistance pump [Mesobacillus stamsii]